MPLPKGFRKNIKLKHQKVGPARRQEILDGIDNQGTFLPKGVGYEDMDKSFIEMVGEDFSLDIDGEKVPVIFLTIQRWAEFSKTWQNSDKFKDIQLPFITIVRRPDIQVGTNQNGNWNIPQGRRTYTYVKVPTFDGGKEGVDLYKIPQPTAVDITYEVRLFCNKMKDLNKLYSIIHQEFQSRQHYIVPNGHYMPVLLENIGDESQVDDFENRRFYVQLFEMRLQGYLLDEDRFEVVPTVNKAVVMEELMRDKVFKKPIIKTEFDNESVNYNYIFRPNAESIVTTRAEFDINFISLTNMSNINDMTIKVNGRDVSIPFIVSAGDDITIEVDKLVNATSSFLLTGNLI